MATPSGQHRGWHWNLPNSRLDMVVNGTTVGHMTSTLATFATDVGFGSQSLKFDYALLKSTSDDGGDLQVRDSADSAYGWLKAGTLNPMSSGISFTGTNAQAISAPGATDWHVVLKAQDTGVGLVEIGRMAGAADPYFSFGGSQEFKFSNGGQAGFYGASLAAQPAHIIDADGNLADITTKFNTLLAQLATLGLQASS